MDAVNQELAQYATQFLHGQKQMELRRRYLPYCIIQFENAKYVVLNRYYMPLGITDLDWMDYDLYIRDIPGLDDELARRVSWNGRGFKAVLRYSWEKSLFLYSNRTTPVDKRRMDVYIEHLSRLHPTAWIPYRVRPQDIGRVKVPWTLVEPTSTDQS
jgi:hypothetical protein